MARVTIALDRFASYSLSCHQVMHWMPHGYLGIFNTAATQFQSTQYSFDSPPSTSSLRKNLIADFAGSSRIQIRAMADRIHPAADSPSTSGKITKQPEIPSFLPKPQLTAGTYVVQVPKDQIYRFPPPENARKFQNLRRRKNRRSGCCCCLCWITSLIFLLIILIAIAAGVMYLVLQPKRPKYSVDSLSVKGFNLTSSLNFSPEFDVTVRAENPNGRIGMDYRNGSSVTVSSSDVELCNGVLPVFYQGTKNTTVFRTALRSSGIHLPNSIHETLVAQQRIGAVPLVLRLNVPVRVKVGAVKSWTVTVKVRCLLRVDKLAEDSKILDNECKVVEVNL